jgi:hypothetical protein
MEQTIVLRCASPYRARLFSSAFSIAACARPYFPCRSRLKPSAL